MARTGNALEEDPTEPHLDAIQPVGPAEDGEDDYSPEDDAPEEEDD